LKVCWIDFSLFEPQDHRDAILTREFGYLLLHLVIGLIEDLRFAKCHFLVLELRFDLQVSPHAGQAFLKVCVFRCAWFELFEFLYFGVTLTLGVTDVGFVGVSILIEGVFFGLKPLMVLEYGLQVDDRYSRSLLLLRPERSVGS